jgi:hypothetical protein
MIRECRKRMRNMNRNTRGGHVNNNANPRYFYSKNASVGQRNFPPRNDGNGYAYRNNNGNRFTNYDRNFPPVGQYNNRGNKRGNWYNSRPQQQQRPLLPPHLRNYNHNNNRGAPNHVNMVDSVPVGPNLYGDHISRADDDSKNE